MAKKSNKKRTSMSLDIDLLEALNEVKPKRENMSPFINDLLKAVVIPPNFFHQLEKAHSLCEDNEDIFDTIREILDDGSKEIIKKKG